MATPVPTTARRLDQALGTGAVPPKTVPVPVVADDTGSMRPEFVVQAILSFTLRTPGGIDAGGVMEDASRRLSPSGFMQLCDGNDIRRFSHEQIVFREGDACDGLYVVLSGRLKLYSATGNGRELVYDVVGPGELLGELSLDGGPRSVSVKAVTEAACLVLKLSVVRTLMRTRPEFSDHILGKLITRARQSTRLTRSIALDGVLERVAALLEANATPDGAVRRIPSELTQQEIADRIGASREMVHKVIGELVRDGFLQRDEKRRMSILKPLPRCI